MSNREKSISKQMIHKSIKKHVGSLISILFFSLTITALSIINPIIYQKVADDFIPEKNVNALIICIVLVIIVPIISAFISLLKNKMNYWFGKKCIYDVTDTVFKKILRSDFAQYNQYDSVTLSNILTRSAEAIPSMYLSSIVNTFSSVTQFIAVFAMLLHYNIVLTLASFVFLPLSYFIIESQKKKMREASHAGLTEQRNFQKNIVQIFNGMKTIRSYNAQKNAEEIFENGLNDFNKAEWKFRKMECLAGDVLPTSVSQIVLGAVFAIGALFVLNDKMSIGALVAVIAYLPALISSLNGVMKARLSINSIGNILKEFDEIMNLDDELTCSVLPEKTSDDIMSLKKVDFSYGRENFKLHIDELEIRKGEFVAIVGTSGGGKSSVIDIVNKFFPITSGSVKIFEKDINAIDTDSLRKMYSVVTQDVFLFNDTIENNISFPDTPDSVKISKAIEKAQLTDFIKELPEHEKTLISDFGENLSGGECQRISIARALYRDAQVMLLDEPTSALDAETSGKIFEMLLAERKEKNKTILLITHDVKKACVADKVVVINCGKVAEYGKPNELLENNGAFQSLFLAQDNTHPI
ncbi:MAG: ABC transporter ATP-binding protein [Acutalibacteraceae bacterium]